MSAPAPRPASTSCCGTRAHWNLFRTVLAHRRGLMVSEGMNDALSLARDLLRCPSVTPADATAWTHGAFSGDVKDGFLYGRGAVDMKGGIACGVAAVLDYLAAHGGKPGRNGKGSISFLITGDEEAISVNGTIKLLRWVAARGEKFDHCVLGEPSNIEALGDCIKVGRRGSLSGTLYVDGVQGHVAYPHRASNPVPDISALVVALSNEPLDHGSAQFQA